MKEVVLIKKTNDKYLDGSYLSLYKCYCGKQFKALARHIRSKKTVSCGCYRKSGGSKHRIGKTPANALKDPTESSFNGLFGGYKASAKNKGLEFRIDKEYFRELTRQRCHYCNIEPLKEHKHTKYSREPYIYNGIDRKDNYKGYTKENCLPCCSTCNYLKKDTDYYEFVSHIKSIARNLKD